MQFVILGFWWLLCWVFGPAGLAQAPAGDFVSEIVYSSPNGVNALAFDPGGHLLYVEKQGRVMRLASNGSGGFAATPTEFADLRAQIDSAGESGLLGMALSPAYTSTRYLNLFYTTASDQRLTRITANPSLTAMVPGSGLVLLSGLPRASSFHKAGERIEGQEIQSHFFRTVWRSVRCGLMPSSGPHACRAALYSSVPVLGGARGAFAPRARPACGCLPGALAVSRASGDVDAMLKSLCVGRVRTYQTRSWFWFS